MKKNVRNILSAALVLALLAVVLIVPAMAEEAGITTAEQLKSAIANGGEITLGGNIDVGTAIVVEKEVVLNLNGKTLTCPNDEFGDGIFRVVKGGKLTINGEGTINSVGENNYSMAIWADGGEVIINGGTYTNEGCTKEESDNDHYDLIYVKNGGSVSIHGGTFICETPKWTLNSNDSSNGAFKVHGGTFIGYDPTAADTEPGGPVNWVATGSTCTAVGSTYDVTGVAAIGNAQYATLQDAINAANAGETVTLLKSEQLNTGLTVAVGKEIVFDLNGCVLSGVSSTAGSSALITNNGTLTINDSSEAKTGKLTTQAENPDTEWEAGFPAWANNTITNCGTLTINGGRIENTTGEGFCVPIDNNSGNRDAVLIVNGGEIVHTDGNIAVRQFANSAANKNSVTVNDGLLEGKRAVWIQLPGSDTTKAMNAELIVNGGTLRSTDKGEGGYNLAVYSYTYGNSFANTKLTIEDGIFDGDVALAGGSNKTVLESVSVAGGTFLGDYGIYSYGETPETGFIAGGNFAASPEEGNYASYLADGYSVGKVGDYYLVHKHALNFVAANAATYTTNGNTAYYACSVCGEYFEDAAGAKPILDKNTVVIPANNNGEFQLNVPMEIDQDTYHYYLFTPDESGIYLFKSLWSGSTYIDRVRIAQTGTIIGHIGENVHAEDDIYAIFYELEAGTTYAIMISGSKNTYTVERPVVPTSIKFELDFEEAEFDDWFTWQTPLINYVTVYPYNAYADLDNELTFSTSDEKILALTDSSAWAFMEPVDAGKVTITAKLGNLTATDTVEVMPKPVLVPGKPATADRPFRMYWYFTPQHSGTYTLTVEFKDTGAWIAVGLPDAIDPILNESLSEAGTKTYKLEMEGGKEYFFVAEYDTSPVLTIGTEHELVKVDAVDATCTKDGNVEHYHCAACNKNFNADGEELNIISLGAVSHTVREVKAVAATCTEDGIIAHGHCDMCGKNFDADGKELTTVVVAAKGHKLTKVEAKEATCTEDGVIAHYNCSECKKNFSDEKGEKELTTVVVAAKGHKLTKVEAKEATYTEAGNIEHYACACGKLFADAEGKKEITDVVIPQLIKVEEEKAEVSEDAVDNAIADAKEKAEETGKPVEVIIEVPKAPVVEEPDDDETSDTPEVKPQEIVKVELPVEALENVAKEEATLTVILPSVTVTVDTDALKSVTEQAAGNTVTLVVEQIEEETLTEKQQEAVKKYDVAVTIKAEFICQETNEKIWTEDNNAEKESGSVTVKMPFAPAEGTEGADYTVLFIDDDGTVKEIETAFVDGHLVFALEHFSEYVVVNTKTVSETPDTGDNAMLAPFAMLLALSFAGVAVLVSGKKKLI